MLLSHVVTRMPHAPAIRASSRWVLAGAALVAFGWTYPYFVRTDAWTEYAYASPFGLLPCPTLAVVIGITLIFSGLRAAGWSVPLFAAGVLYGVIGIFSLRVSLDIGLLAGAILLGMMVAADVAPGRVRASDHERTRRLPGDECVPAAVGTPTHAITIDGPPAAVWPWIVQMGAGSRAGWYSVLTFEPQQSLVLGGPTLMVRRW